jgi:hypothetical protein
MEILADALKLIFFFITMMAIASIVNRVKRTI